MKLHPKYSPQNQALLECDLACFRAALPYPAQQDTMEEWPQPQPLLSELTRTGYMEELHCGIVQVRNGGRTRAARACTTWKWILDQGVPDLTKAKPLSLQLMYCPSNFIGKMTSNGGFNHSICDMSIPGPS